MLISELISVLQDLPQDAYVEVLASWYNGDDVHDMREIEIFYYDNLGIFVIVPSIQPTMDVVKSEYGLTNIKEL